MTEKMTRKEFLRQFGMLAAAVFGSSIVAACGGEKEEARQTGGRPTGGTRSTPQTAQKPAADPCADLSGISETDLKMRETLSYVSVSTEPDKNCENCKFWQPPAAGEPCGGCTLVKGPIHAGGYCTSWFERDA